MYFSTLTSLALFGVALALPALPVATPVSPLKPSPCLGLGTICLAEQVATYDPTLQSCTCQWLPGLDPTSSTSPISDRQTLTEPTTDSCPNILCEAQQQPVFVPSLKECLCELIPGLQPGGPNVTITAPVTGGETPGKEKRGWFGWLW